MRNKKKLFEDFKLQLWNQTCLKTKIIIFLHKMKSVIRPFSNPANIMHAELIAEL